MVASCHQDLDALSKKDLRFLRQVGFNLGLDPAVAHAAAGDCSEPAEQSVDNAGETGGHRRYALAVVPAMAGKPCLRLLLE